jgi:hypothetical protein
MGILTFWTGGKVLIEISLLISVAATTIRIRLRGRGFRYE